MASTPGPRAGDRAPRGRGSRWPARLDQGAARRRRRDQPAHCSGGAGGRRCRRGPARAGARRTGPLGMTRRRRGALLLGLAAVCAALAASSVDRYADDVAAQVGPLQPVLVAARDLPRGTLITPGVARAALVVRRVPLRFAPRRPLHDPRRALGYRALTSIAAGDYVGEYQLGTARPQRPAAAEG